MRYWFERELSICITVKCVIHGCNCTIEKKNAQSSKTWILLLSMLDIEIEVRHWKVLRPSKITCEYKISSQNPSRGDCIQSHDTTSRWWKDCAEVLRDQQKKKKKRSNQREKRRFSLGQLRAISYLDISRCPQLLSLKKVFLIYHQFWLVHRNLAFLFKYVALLDHFINKF